MKKPLVQVAAGIIRNEFGQIYLTQRLEGQDFAQSLEFPGGKVDKNGIKTARIKNSTLAIIKCMTALVILVIVNKELGFYGCSCLIFSVRRGTTSNRSPTIP